MIIVGIGRDQGLYQRANVASWTPVPGEGTVKDVAVLPNGSLLGVGAGGGGLLENQLYVRATLTGGWARPWTRVPETGAVSCVTVMDDGTILGVGTDARLYTRATLAGRWELVDEAERLVDVEAVTTTTSEPGGIFGVTTNGSICYRTSLAEAWRVPAPMRMASSVTVLPDGSLLVTHYGDDIVGVYRDGRWRWFDAAGHQRRVTVLPDGTLLGIAADGRLASTPELPVGWSSPLADVVDCATAMPDGTIVATRVRGGRAELCTAPRLGAPWTVVEPSPSWMKSLAVFPDGRLLGRDLHGLLHTRDTLASSWKVVPDSQGAFSVTVLPDGVIVGAHEGSGYLMVRPTLRTEWRVITDPALRSYFLAAQPDGSLLGVWQERLVRCPALGQPWAAVAELPRAGLTGLFTVPDETTSEPSASRWLLQFTTRDPAAPDGDGRPWGDGTAMSRRAPAAQQPWDNGCLVTPLVGGYAALGAIRDAFESGIADAEAQAGRGVAAGRRGHVHIVDWLLNGQRDLSQDNPWGGGTWDPPTQTVPRDQTALGLILRMMSAGIVVRVMLWMPTTPQGGLGGSSVAALSEEHWAVAAAIQDHAGKLKELWPDVAEPMGVCLLDLRTAAPSSAALHQKMVCVRVGAVDVAFCGGVDLAFTRRDFGRPLGSTIGAGDWQSGGKPVRTADWPRQSPPPAGGYPRFPYAESRAPASFPEDLAPRVYGASGLHWHDQHLKLEGPIVATLDEQFAERWVMDASRVRHFVRSERLTGLDNQVKLTSLAAIDGDAVRPLPAAAPSPPVGDASVQMWRTIPLRPNSIAEPFVRGEFTVMAGVANAVARAKRLITIWDQYFWSEPLAKLLAHRLQVEPRLRLLIVLPPWGASDASNEMYLRMLAAQALWSRLDDAQRKRVHAFGLWARGAGVGVYVHAKVQTYDDELLVCGSANMNRRSFESDAELNCAVMHRPTTRMHHANLFAALTGQRRWSDFDSDDWPRTYVESIAAAQSRSLVVDPFFATTIPARPELPNGVRIPYEGISARALYSAYEPTSIGPSVGTGTCGGRGGDPQAPGRLDEVSFLLERCHEAGSWPWRKPARKV